jgi:toxin ParE1/3/4
MSQFLITLEASRDLNEIVDYFQERNLDAGDRFVAAFNQKCQYLTQFPNLGKHYPHLQPSLRGISLNQYIIFYQTVPDGIIILRVVNGSRDLLSLFEESN